ncbi:oligosaccharide flippase family protein [Streptomyces sp. P38-E01]|uniref:Oligosaccharide flippase family protein n=1 Tax=Streptomyces tardus TaxID=2780544 RepID=A0A949JJH0_9ACTN|nr:lipid II flippase MurJ [Streptomyces tardus]MBU7599834.1 oligosaccharide flippase family protein [Streptomyces tardus]
MNDRTAQDPTAQDPTAPGPIAQDPTGHDPTALGEPPEAPEAPEPPEPPEHPERPEPPPDRPAPEPDRLATGPPKPADRPTDTSPLGRVLARAAVWTAALTALGSLLGLIRDQTIAHLFGAGSDTDAFLVAWTVPEFASTLLIEDAMALVLVPAVSLALARRAEQSGRPLDPVRELVAGTLPRLALVLAAVAGCAALGAPLFVAALAPGLEDPQLAVQCTRLTALTLLSFGITGYFSATLRAHHCYLPPAAVYAVYNLGIIATVLLLHDRWGVVAAAAGVAVGGALMTLVQLPSFLRRLPRRSPAPRLRGRARAPRSLISVGLLAPVVTFALGRQAQVLVERFLGSELPAGAISHLNYAQKIAQLPMVLSLMVCTVTFPVVARAMAEGRREDARRRVERDLSLAALIVLLGSAYVLALAPQIVEVLFQRGAFTASDTAATAAVMRVYALGLLGHSMVGALARPFFSAARPTWYPALAMGTGLAATIALGAFATPHWGIHGIAGANAAGITLAALLLLRGLSRRMIAIEVPAVLGGVGRLLVAAAAAAGAGLLAVPLFGGAALPAAVLGAALVAAVFTAAALLLRAPEVPPLMSAARRAVGRAVTRVERKVRHVR